MKNTLIKFFLFTLAMLVARAYMTGHYSFFFLLWNLFLAWLPCWFVSKLSAAPNKLNRNILLGLTVLFLPNAPYITTDLFHLTKHLVAPLWFDTVLILNFSLMGLICFVHASALLFEELRRIIESRFLFRLVKLGLFFLCGYGIYLGRYLRFNSWDVLAAPFDLVGKMYDSLFAPGHSKETLGISITFAVFLYLIFELYEFFHPLNKSHDLSQKTRQSH